MKLVWGNLDENDEHYLSFTNKFLEYLIFITRNDEKRSNISDTFYDVCRKKEYFTIFDFIFMVIADYMTPDGKTNKEMTQFLIDKIEMAVLVVFNMSDIYRLKPNFADYYYVSSNQTIDKVILKLSLLENAIRNSNYLLNKKHIDFLLEVLPNFNTIFGDGYKDAEAVIEII